ncbi:UNVERIFIED_CONTAM: Zn-dependent M32 family carboxypeptidase [Brevibacillus sp. OAP136]
MKKAWVASLVASSLFFGAVSVVGAEEVTPKEKPKQVLKEERQALKDLRTERQAVQDEIKQLRQQVRDIVKATPKEQRKQLVQSWIDWKKNHLISKDERAQRKTDNEAARAAIKAAIQQKDFATAEKDLQDLLAVKQTRKQAADQISAELQQLLNQLKTTGTIN